MCVINSFSSDRDIHHALVLRIMHLHYTLSNCTCRFVVSIFHDFSISTIRSVLKKPTHNIYSKIKLCDPVHVCMHVKRSVQICMQMKRPVIRECMKI